MGIRQFQPNAWPGAKEYMARSSADFVTSQETKLAEHERTDAERNAGWRIVISPCTSTAAEGKSAGVAAGSKTQVGMSNSVSPHVRPAVLRDRFTLKHVGAVCRGGIHAGSCYLISCNAGIKDQRNLDILQLMAGILKAVKSPGGIGGDWNCTPQELLDTCWLEVVKGKLVTPQTPTCGDRTIDLSVVSKSMHHAADAACTIGDDGFYPHRPVRLLRRANARTAMVRQLTVPAGVEATVPCGPVTLPSSQAPPGTGGNTAPGTGRDPKDYAGLIRTIEAELCVVEGLDGEDAAKKSGRREGVKYCWKNALGDTTAESGMTTSVSRAWNWSAVWQIDITKTKDCRVAGADMCKLTRYMHPKPDPARASVAQLSAMACFDVWQKSLARGQLLTKVWIEMLMFVATKQAEAEESTAQIAAVVKWTSWLLEGPANGLRRLHRFTRVATGWTEVADNKGNGNQLG